LELAFPLQLFAMMGGFMRSVLRNIFYFVAGRNASRGAARMIGLGRFAALIGIIGGLRYMRRHQLRPRT
jgi:hypothetical protein